MKIVQRSILFIIALLSTSYTYAENYYEAKAINEQVEAIRPLNLDQLFQLQLKADAGDNVSKYLYGRQLSAGKSIEPNHELAFKYLKSAADDGSVPGALRLVAEAFSSGNGVSKNPSEATKYFLKAAKLGSGKANYIIAQRYFFGDQDFDRNYQSALPYYQKAYEKLKWNSVAAKLGYMYFQGLGVEKDYCTASKWLDLAIVGDNQRLDSLSRSESHTTQKKTQDISTGSLYLLIGTLYENGFCVEKNDSAAFFSYQNAAKESLPVSMAKLGEMYYLGKGTDKDTEKAKFWLKKYTNSPGNYPNDIYKSRYYLAKIWIESFF